MNLVIGTLYLVLSSCANRVTPGGGIKDTLPPKELTAIPANHSVNFSSKKIEVLFDEYVKLIDQSKQLILSPIIRPLPEIFVKKKSVVIELNPDSLQSNTTYTLNFGSAIADIHEDNVLENFQYVFSTGSYIDSFYVQGNVKNAWNLKNEKGMLVMLYKSKDDSVPYHNVPDYFTKTDESGNFKITNVASGSYRLFALKDENQNYLFDSQKEKIAFAEKDITVPDSSKTDMRFFEEIPEIAQLKNKSFEFPGKLLVVFNRPIENLSYKFINPKLATDNLAKEMNLSRDSIVLWNTDTTRDSLNLVFYSGSSPIDTVKQSLKFKESKSDKENESGVKKINAVSNASSQYIDLNKFLTLSFSQPVAKADLSKVNLLIDSVAEPNLSVYFDDSLKRHLTIEKKWDEKSSYQLFIPAGAFKSIYGYLNDTIRISFKPKEATSYGSLKVKLTLPLENVNYLLQLVDEKDAVVDEKKVSTSGSYIIEFLNPATLKMKLVEDSNGNGKWDTGRYIKKLQPEKVVYFNDDIKIRSNWDLEQEWNLLKK